MIVDATGTPYRGDGIGAPRDEAMEARINAELANLDGLLFVKWFQVPIRGSMEGRYGLCCRWPSHDPRLQWVRDGTHDPAEAHDLLGWVCDDLQNAHTTPRDPEQIKAKAFELLGKCDNVKFPWAQRIRSTAEKNERLTAKRTEEVLDMAHDAAVDQYYHSSRAARVFQGG